MSVVAVLSTFNTRLGNCSQDARCVFLFEANVQAGERIGESFFAFDGSQRLHDGGERLRVQGAFGALLEYRWWQERVG